MSATTFPYGPCISLDQAVPMDKYNFQGEPPVKCVFGCKSNGYKTFRNLHKHYIDWHDICLHGVTDVEPHNEALWRARIIEVLTPFKHENPKGFKRGRVPSQGNQPLLTHPPLPLAGSRTPLLSEAGPSRSPALNLNNRHQPYPQFRPGWPGPPTNYPPVPENAKGKGREIPPPATNHGLPTPDTSPPWANLKNTPPTARPHYGASAHSPFRSNSTLPRPGSPRLATGIPVPTQPSRMSQYSTGPTASDHPHWPSTTQEHSFPGGSTQEHEGFMPGYQAWHTQPRQPQALPRGPAVYLPTPPMGVNSLPERPPRLSAGGEHNRPSQRAGRNRGFGLLGPPGTPRLPRSATPQPAPHPYARPANGFTTSELAQRARENRKQGQQTEVNTPRETSVHCASPFVEGQVLPVENVLQEQIPTAESTPGLLEVQEKETPVPLADRRSHPVNSPIGPTLSHTPLTHDLPPQPCGTPEIVQSMDEPSFGPVIRPVGSSRATDEAAALAPVTQGLRQELAPIQGHSSNGTGGASRNQEDVEDPLSKISWEGFCLIKTPHGTYLPETCNPNPFGLKDYSDWC